MATLPTAAASVLANPLESSGTPVKATLRIPSFRAAMKAAITTHYGSLKATAITFGDVDDSQLLKEWDRGNFLRYDQYADAEAKAFVSAYVDEALGNGQDPKLRARALLRDMRARLDEIDLCIERLL